jgi:hypothetical protein
VARVEEILKRITGLGINLRVELVGGTGTIPSTVPGQDDPGATVSPYKRQRSEALKEPLVKKAMEVLGAQLVEVDEGFGSVPQTTEDAAMESEEN